MLREAGTAMDKPYAPACERNRDPILAVLRDHLAHATRLLEIGSGTGQHAVYFAAALPWLTWQASERPQHLAGVKQWLDEAALPNTPAPWPLDVAASAWPQGWYDAFFTANTLHIMSLREVEALFAALPRVADHSALLVVYGPFNYGGRYTSDSNAAFDSWLKAQSPHQGVRDFEWVDGLAQRAGFHLVEDRAMPANNRCLVWRGRP